MLISNNTKCTRWEIFFNFLLRLFNIFVRYFLECRKWLKSHWNDTISSYKAISSEYKRFNSFKKWNERSFETFLFFFCFWRIENIFRKLSVLGTSTTRESSKSTIFLYYSRAAKGNKEKTKRGSTTMNRDEELRKPASSQGNARYRRRFSWIELFQRIYRKRNVTIFLQRLATEREGGENGRKSRPRRLTAEFMATRRIEFTCATPGQRTGNDSPGKREKLASLVTTATTVPAATIGGIRLTILQHWLLVLWISNCPASRHSLPAFSQQHAIVRDQFHRGPKNFMLTISLQRQTSLSNELPFPSSRERREDFLRPILGNVRPIYNSRYRHWIDRREWGSITVPYRS